MILITFITGIICWTFLEYVMHRFLGHVHKGRNFFKAEHTQHHSKANYFAPAWKKSIAAAFVFALFFSVLNLVAPALHVLAFLTGLFGMYAFYEYVHFRYHSKDPLLFIFITFRKHHFYHHFHNPKTNHGVTTRFWDRVFGTFVRVEQVKVPRKMTMQWLTDGDVIKEIYSADFSFSSAAQTA
jgi:4-hydroxysphinganine ceramide fatty acyl 2-hydroxylase